MKPTGRSSDVCSRLPHRTRFRRPHQRQQGQHFTQYVRRHRLELLAELGSMDGKTRRMHWAITLGGKPLCTMITPPLTFEEALIEARWRWPGAGITE